MPTSSASDNSIAETIRRAAQACEDEPIRIPGSIQRHGFLLLLDANGERVVAASENAEDFLGVPLVLLLGTPVETILEREVLASLRLNLTVDTSGTPSYLGTFHLRGRLYSVTTHRVEVERIVEFEVVDRLVSPELSNQVFANFVGKLGQYSSEMELVEALTRQVKEMTGFNRVMLYRFDEAGHGTVLSEVNDGSLPSYLGLRFPASDIPRQARELYVLNTVRIIPDANYVPSPLRGSGSRSVATLDLSMSVLRSVSPVHIQYMHNMGTLSSMSISMVIEGRLWGLISGHHATPHTVPFLVRSACDLITRLVCNQLVSMKTSNSLKKMVQFHAVHRRMLTSIAAEGDYVAAMSGQMEDVIQITGAGGGALVIDRTCFLFGQTPQQPDVLRLAGWLDEQEDLEVFATRHLSEHIAWADDLKESASGLLAIRISYVRQSYVMWFRPQVLRTVTWAGDPHKPVDPADTLSPRQSFDAWKELVQGKSEPWDEMEIESASDFRGALMTISLKRAEEAVQLGEARFLQLTNSLPHPVWTADDAGHLAFVNRKWLDQGLRDRGLWFAQDAIVADDRQRCVDAWREALAGGTALEIEVRFRTGSDRIERLNLVRAMPYLSVHGTRAGWVGTCTDLTERREREAALRMTEKLALTGRMTSVIAHEINNPLEAITNLLYLLAESVQEDDAARNYIALAESELRRISGITKQTLRWAREGTLKEEYGSVHTLFKDVLQLYAGQIRNRQVAILSDGGEDLRFFGVAGQISQVVANLISNAIQAVPVGGRVWLTARRVDRMVEIAVRDEGTGMSEEALSQLFQPFFSTKGDLGNGLGLYISHEIVERHGGTIEVKSKVGVGTEVCVRIPAVAPAENPA